MNHTYIEWEDHCQIVPESGGSWIELTSLTNKPSVIQSVGFVVKEDEKYVTIASCRDSSVDEKGDVKGVSLIIKSCIIKRIEY